ncbi:hypothetical protein SAE02_61060 [Skermanella aerolata]|uniref:Uncharacterized protein n=1 Tax=Skermanella aerolata TaxID=393310 RepID=A0A512DZP1_9PROT|nr:hypothetical protein [Skermanella aerolata]KJB91940.1 hypothetical protein N826_25825 [Skermanella aerolata KACC 11604]GEO41958.1 hypothetical protein SAE02_61060 [Skermanella aerolata]
MTEEIMTDEAMIAEIIAAVRDGRYRVSKVWDQDYDESERTDTQCKHFGSRSIYTALSCWVRVSLEARGLPDLEIALVVDAAFQKDEGRVIAERVYIDDCNLTYFFDDGSSFWENVWIDGMDEPERDLAHQLFEAVSDHGWTRHRYTKAAEDYVTRLCVLGDDRLREYEYLSSLIAAVSVSLAPTATTQIERVTAVARALNRPVGTVHKWAKRLSAPKGRTYSVVRDQLKALIA